jgi:nucleoid-associated protein YgaU
MYYKKAALIFFSILLSVFIACGEKIPSKELIKARGQISKALTVKADKYAPAEFDLAVQKLFNAHNFVKAGEVDKAKKASEESYLKGVEAYDKALPLMAKDVIDISEQSIASAKDAYADKLAKNEFTSASDMLDKSKKYYEEKKYYDAYISALEADKLAKNARNIALGQKDVLRDSIEDIKLTLKKAEKIGAKKYSAEKFNSASVNLKSAEEGYNNQKLKDGFSAAEVAKMNADQAYIEALEAFAREKIAEADVALGKAEKSKNAKKAKDELEAAKEARNNAKALYEVKKFDDSIQYADESLKHSNFVLGSFIADSSVKDTASSVKDTAAADDKGGKVKSDFVKEDEDYYYYKVVYRKKYPDCLWYISYKFYKNFKMWPKIFNANKDLIKNPDLIHPGWIIKVPKK